MHMQLLPSIFISGLVLLKINSCNLLFDMSLLRYSVLANLYRLVFSFLIF
jgi:hypothetical protein